jgi:hypothetical protein
MPLSEPQTRNEYSAPAARPVTFVEKGPLTPAGQRNPEELRGSAGEPVSPYLKLLKAGPLFAVPCALRVADSGPMSVAGSVDA